MVKIFCKGFLCSKENRKKCVKCGIFVCGVCGCEILGKRYCIDCGLEIQITEFYHIFKAEWDKMLEDIEEYNKEEELKAKEHITEEEENLLQKIRRKHRKPISYIEE